jgi:Outer membrane protein beta-barrel domain
MKSEKNKLEQKIRAKIYHSTTEVPSDMWSKIEQKISTPKSIAATKASKMGWMLLADLLLLFLLAVPTTKKINPLPSASKYEQATAYIAPQISSDASKNSTSKIAQSKSSKTLAKENLVKKIKSSNNSPIEKISHENYKINYSASITSLIPAIATKEVKNTLVGELAPNFTEVAKSGIIDTEKNGIHSTSSATLNMETEPLNGSATPASKPDNNSNENSNNNSTIPAESMSKKDSIISSKDLLHVDKIDNSISLLAPPLAKDSASSNSILSKISFELFGSPDYYFVQQNEKKNLGYIARVDSAGIQKQAWSAGMRIGYNLTKTIQLKTGIYYSSLALNYKLANTQTFSELVVDSTSIFYTLQDPFNLPTIIKVYDSIYETKSSTEILETKLRFKMIDIPILAAYSYSINKVRLGINTGVSFNLLFQKEGQYILPTEFEETKVREEVTPAYRKKLGMSWIVGASCAYVINSNVSIFIEPHYTSILKSVHTDDYQLQQNWSKLGMHTGLLVKF